MPDKIVNHFVLADGSTAKYDAGALLNLDDTVSLAGYAPDAKAVGDRLTDSKKYLGAITSVDVVAHNTKTLTGTNATVWVVDAPISIMSGMYINLLSATNNTTTGRKIWFRVQYTDDTLTDTSVYDVGEWYPINVDSSKTIRQILIQFIRSDATLSESTTSEWEYLIVHGEPTEVINSKSELQHPFAMGSVVGYINIDTINKNVNIPIGTFYIPKSKDVFDAPAVSLDYSTIRWWAVVVINYTTRNYEIYDYTAYRNLSSDNMQAIIIFRCPLPKYHTSPYPVTIDGFTDVVTSGSDIEGYWVTELDSVIDDVALLQTYENGVTFGFITDIHWETNWQKSPKLIDYITSHSRVNMWINGGDSATGDGGDGTEQKELLYNCIGSFGKGYKFYSLNGNHDTNQIGGGTMLTSADIKNLVMPYDNDVTFGNGNYYYFDYRGTRFVCLDTGTNGLSDSTQTTWAASVISASQLPVIVCMHIVKISYTDENPCPFFNDLITAIGANSDVKVKMIIGGHSHRDFNFIASNGIPVIVLDTDSKSSDDGITRFEGTISEQCLSIVTIDYDAKRIVVNRVGSIGSDITVNY